MVCCFKAVSTDSVIETVQVVGTVSCGSAEVVAAVLSVNFSSGRQQCDAIDIVNTLDEARVYES
jgi:hypothetical protein